MTLEVLSVAGNMKRDDIEAAAIMAGFQTVPAERGSIRMLFTRGKNFLNVHTDGKWAFYSEIADGKKPDRYGSDFPSLLKFLVEKDVSMP